MNSDQALPARATFGGEIFRRQPWLTYIFAAMTLLGWFGGRFLTFLFPDASYWLLLIGAFGAVVALIWLIACAFLPKPRSAPILLATLVIIQAAGMIKAQSGGGLTGWGFRIHASPIEQYLAKCKKFDFAENGEMHTISACESSAFEPGFPPGLAYLTVIHDPTGNLLKPESKRSQEWNRALYKVRETEAAILRFEGATRLSNDFYLATLSY
ncbi:hypothetical protein [Bradyrhizobium sp. I71]|uniref:hypothetical protein n=1 Tax=Bradyrhizobium sp. I71 TaxID=2590772 RepID=UPI001EF8349B|nr:hypothetical protein [Bradyrhizobium sp. I71]ULK99354.1 hypothetical protein FJV43_06310 [Bradyrhizobium sp. I71]